MQKLFGSPCETNVERQTSRATPSKALAESQISTATSSNAMVVFETNACQISRAMSSNAICTSEITLWKPIESGSSMSSSSMLTPAKKIAAMLNKDIYKMASSVSSAMPADSEAKTSECSGSNYKQYYDVFTGAYVRSYVDGQQVVGAMQKGPNGFQLAIFGPNDSVETEMPNVPLPIVSREVQDQLVAAAKAKAKAKGKAKAKAKASPKASPKGKAKAKAKASPKGKAKAKAKAKPQAKAKAQGKAQAQPQAHAQDALFRHFTDIRLTSAFSGTIRTYITGKNAEGKKQLITELTARHNADHRALMEELKLLVEENNFSKEEAKEWRDSKIL